MAGDFLRQNVIPRMGSRARKPFGNLLNAMWLLAGAAEHSTKIDIDPVRVVQTPVVHCIGKGHCWNVPVSHILSATMGELGPEVATSSVLNEEFADSVGPLEWSLILEPFGDFVVDVSLSGTSTKALELTGQIVRVPGICALNGLTIPLEAELVADDALAPCPVGHLVRVDFHHSGLSGQVSLEKIQSLSVAHTLKQLEQELVFLLFRHCIEYVWKPRHYSNI